MLMWCIVLLALGLFGVVLDSGILGEAGNASRAVTWLLMLSVVGILIRVRTKEKTGEKEVLRARIAELERRLRSRGFGH